MRNIKIAILTFHRAINYGAILQAYALQRALIILGYDVEILDYRNDLIEKSYYSPLGSSKKTKGIIKSLLYFNVQRARNKAFNHFRKNMIVSNKKYNRRTISETAYDYYITGSDQVWNLKCTNYDPVYFLNFVSADKRVSYAASLGKYKDIIDSYDQFYGFLRDFKWISVRENAGRELLKNKVDKNMYIDVDPTFLLKREEWDKLAMKSKLNDYVLIYSVNLNMDVLTVGRKIKKEKGKKLLILTLRNKPIKLLENEILLQKSSPEEFLGLIKDANCVVTNSFHGTAFSIIFNSDFYLVKNSKEDLDNTRLDSLLEKFGLSDRIVESNSFEFKDSINYELVNERVNAEVQTSINHLTKSIHK